MKYFSLTGWCPFTGSCKGNLKLFLALGIFLILSSISWADIPNLINFQGILDSAGNPLANKTVSVEFRIYNALVGGTAYWSETQSVTTNAGGVFNVLLGSSNPIPDTAFDDTLRWLGIKVGTDAEMTPRQQIVSNAYGYRVRTVDGATGGVISGDVDIQSDLTVSGNVELPPSTFTTVGLIKSGADRFIHNFGTENFFAGVNAGNFTLSSPLGGNTGVGASALQNLTTGVYNTAVGNASLQNNTAGVFNTAMGQAALFNNTTGYQNTAMGHASLQNNTTGTDNTAMGQSALFFNSTGFSNTAMGQAALFNNTTGTNNTAMGQSALFFNSTGFFNTAVGLSALFSNTTGSNNTAVGNSANVAAGGLTNATAIGANAIVAVSNALVLGGTGVNAVNVGIGTTSPDRDLVVKKLAADVYLQLNNATLSGRRWNLISSGTGSGNPAGSFGIQDENAASTRLLIDNTGRVGLSINPFHPLHLASGAHCTVGGTWTNASSKQYKTDIEPLQNKEYSEILKKLDKLDVVRFKYKADPSREHIGLIAEDVPDEIASDDRTGIPTADAIGFLMAALKAQQTEIESLKQMLKQLQDEQSEEK